MPTRTFTSGVNVTSAGSVTITFSTQNAGLFDETFDIDVLSIGDIEYSFDIPEGSTDVTGIGMILGKMDMTINERVTDSSGEPQSFMEKFDLTGIASLYEEVVKVNLNIVVDSGDSYDFIFCFQRKDIEKDEKSREVKIKMRGFPSSQDDVIKSSTIDDYYQGNISGVNISSYKESVFISAGSPSPPPYDEVEFVVHSSHFIRDVLSIYDPNGDFLLQTDPDNTNHVFPPSYTIGSEVNVVNVSKQSPINGTEISSIYGTSKIIELLSNYAALDGAIFGSAFNKNFYVQRLYEGTPVTLGSADLLSLKSIRPSYPYRSITASDGVNTGSYTTLVNITGQKSFRFVAKTGLGAVTAQVKAGSPGQDLELVTGETSLQDKYLIEDLDRTARAYAFPTGSANIARNISMKVIGFDTIKPYETFTFGATIDDDYAVRVYRPSRLKYSINNNHIEIDAYTVGLS